MKLTAYGITDIGEKRANNEDSFLIVAEKNLYIVADGMGGHNAGEVASTNAVNIINQYLTSQRITKMKEDRQAVKKEITDAVFTAHEWILKAGRDKRDYYGMGTTIVVCFIHNATLHTCHVGDSRAYVITADRIQRITDDHSYVRELVRAGKMTSEEARHSYLKNQISQALGSPFSIEPEYHEHPLDNDSSVLLCSDGLWDMLSDTEIQDAVAANRDPEETCRGLVQKANEAGGADNITVVLIRTC